MIVFTTLGTMNTAERTFAPKRPIKNDLPSHPASWYAILADHVPMSIATAARRMCVNRQSFAAMLAGHRPVTADMALRFRKLTGGEPGLYVHMQA